ncbi:hypothetical protein Tco_1258002, partial [Tanacetum coccineum]
CFDRRFTRSVSIGGSRGVSPSEVHEECLHRRIARSRITRSVSIGGSRGVSLSKGHEECLNRSPQGVSPSKSLSSWAS